METIIPTTHDLGDFKVRRTLPSRPQRPKFRFRPAVADQPNAASVSLRRFWLIEFSRSRSSGITTSVLMLYSTNATSVPAYGRRNPLPCGPSSPPTKNRP